ncbi:MAG: hypothetical protein E6Q50_11580 [Lysobacter sp.]|nr:MAG: hypothetical protein E6Q50_11580 [Lysobacter sp.]
MIVRSLTVVVWAVCALTACAAPMPPRSGAVPVQGADQSERALDTPGCAQEVDLNVGYDDAAEYQFLLTGRACIEMLPPHIVAFLRDLAKIAPGLDEERIRAYTTEKQKFRAIPGEGRRPDYTVELENDALWIRSFEGEDTATTFYLVYGAGCAFDCEPRKHPAYDFTVPMPRSHYRVFRAKTGEALVDITREAIPQMPKLSARERRRYGPYLHETGEADELDLVLDANKLQYVPTLRWALIQPNTGDYTPPPLPPSDPRVRADVGDATFGFLVWTGQRFEMRDDVSPSQWTCTEYPSALPKCD